MWKGGGRRRNIHELILSGLRHSPGIPVGLLYHLWSPAKPCGVGCLCHVPGSHAVGGPPHGSWRTGPNPAISTSCPVRTTKSPFRKGGFRGIGTLPHASLQLFLPVTPKPPAYTFQAWGVIPSPKVRTHSGLATPPHRQSPSEPTRRAAILGYVHTDESPEPTGRGCGCRPRHSISARIILGRQHPL